MQLIELGIGELNAKQRFLWEQYKAMTRQFAHDMLLAEVNSEEIAELYPRPWPEMKRPPKWVAEVTPQLVVWPKPSPPSPHPDSMNRVPTQVHPPKCSAPLRSSWP